MALTLAQMIDEVEAELKDTANAIWSTTEVQDHIARALQDYSRARPRLLAAQIACSAGVREYALSISDLMFVTDVWYPYDTASPTWPPPRPRWFIPSDGVLFLDVASAPTAAQKLRVFYAAPHTINGLDGATVTTLNKDGELLVIAGASAYANLQEAQHLVGAVTVSDDTQRQYMAWAEARLKHFQEALLAMAPARYTPFNGGPAAQPPLNSPKGGL